MPTSLASDFSETTGPSEDEVVHAVCSHLRTSGWGIQSFALAHQHGDDIVATRGAERLIVEAKGAGSSKNWSKRFGQPFTRSQVRTHVSVAVHRAMSVWSTGAAQPALAFPDDLHHHAMADPIHRVLMQLDIWVFWVGKDGSVTVDGG